VELGRRQDGIWRSSPTGCIGNSIHRVTAALRLDRVKGSNVKRVVREVAGRRLERIGRDLPRQSWRDLPNRLHLPAKGGLLRSQPVGVTTAQRVDMVKGSDAKRATCETSGRVPERIDGHVSHLHHEDHARWCRQIRRGFSERLDLLLRLR
jgi:hypothetical protein